ncbi:Hypothetical predicted protein, partial [Marmota monax]
MLEEAGEVLENMLKASCLPLGFIVFLPAVLLLVAPPLPAADAAHEFTVYRMQQYDLQGQPYGTRNAVLNTEARTMDADVLSRRCVLMRLADFSYEQYQKALRQSAGAVVIILPRAMAAVPQDVVRQFMEIEPEMLAMETIVPVYFAVEDEALLSIYEQTQAASASQGSASAAEGRLQPGQGGRRPEQRPGLGPPSLCPGAAAGPGTAWGPVPTFPFCGTQPARPLWANLCEEAAASPPWGRVGQQHSRERTRL